MVRGIIQGCGGFDSMKARFFQRLFGNRYFLIEACGLIGIPGFSSGFRIGVRFKAFAGAGSVSVIESIGTVS